MEWLWLVAAYVLFVIYLFLRDQNRAAWEMFGYGGRGQPRRPRKGHDWEGAPIFAPTKVTWTWDWRHLRFSYIIKPCMVHYAEHVPADPTAAKAYREGMRRIGVGEKPFPDGEERILSLGPLRVIVRRHAWYRDASGDPRFPPSPPPPLQSRPIPRDYGTPPSPPGPLDWPYPGRSTGSPPPPRDPWRSTGSPPPPGDRVDYTPPSPQPPPLSWPYRRRSTISRLRPWSDYDH